MYVREVGPKGFPQTFVQFMEANAGLRTMIEEGRGKLEWERKIPDEKLEELKSMLSAADFKANMPKVMRFLGTELLLWFTSFGRLHETVSFLVHLGKVG